VADVCPRCGEPIDDPSANFCEECGFELGAEPPALRECRGCGHRYAGEFCDECGLFPRDPADHVEVDRGLLAGISDRGHVHARNEDAMSLDVRDGVMAAVVCDGVSTVSTPEDASRTAADTALPLLLDTGAGPAEERIVDAVAAAAQAVTALPPGDRPGPPSCTLVAGIVEPAADGGADVTVAWLGDSRAYWLDAEEPANSGALTRDHSWAEEMIAAGVLDVETAIASPQAHGITRWIGADGFTEPEVGAFHAPGPGVLLICSDGLWNYLPGAVDLAAVALPAVEEKGPLAAATALTGIALDAGGRDNITVVLIPVGLPVGSGRSAS
jgi:PPM family protein phosphatase